VRNKIKGKEKNMKNSKKKTFTLIALFMMFGMVVSLFGLPAANAQGTKETYAYIGATPNPIGVGQETLLHTGITDQLASAIYGWEGLTISVERPDGETETLGPFRTDATGGTGTIYVPTMTGTYYLQTHFPEQTNPATTAGIPAGTVMLSSDSEKLALIVTEQPRVLYPTLPLPTEYWTRPINSQLREWSAVAGNWLWGYRQNTNNFATGNDEAPDTAHILWAKSLTTGGLVGEPLGDHSFEIGDAYEGKFLGSIVMAGKLYFDKYATADPYHEIVCVDLHTGETLWSRTLLNNLTITRGQLMYWDTYDYHGVYDYIWATGNGGTRSLLGLSSSAGNPWCAFDPFTGDFVYALYGVPSGSVTYGPKGEIIVYTINTRNGWMTMWNSTNIPALTASKEYGSMGWGQWRAMGKIIDASGPDGVTLNGQPYTSPVTPFGLNGYMWNVSIPNDLPGGVQSLQDDRVIGGSFSTTEVNLWGLNLNESNGALGRVLFDTTWKAPAEWAAGNVTLAWAATSSEGVGGVFIINVKETRVAYGFSTGTGNYIWGPTEPRGYLDIYTMGLSASSMRAVSQIAYGKYYAGSYAGTLYCYDAHSGDLLWTYNATDPFNEILWGNNWPLYPVFITDGKIYLRHAEHSPVDPRPRGAPFICLNATTGEEIWRVDGLFRGTHWGGYPVIGDSIIATMDTYDQRVYAIGKGPSAITVSAPNVGVTLGKSVLVSGMVTDNSPGAADYALTSRFPNGVPAVSDESISDWMLYLYGQFPRPANATGVEVVVSVVDPNNNIYEVGRATSDSSGIYNVAFIPEVPGKYTVIASFDGSGAYYGSFAEAGINVEEAPAATPVPTQTPAPMTETYLLGLGIAALIAIIVIGLIIILMLRKR
jgi:outer membrane protein assembly factor BamB